MSAPNDSACFAAHLLKAGAAEGLFFRAVARYSNAMRGHPVKSEKRLETLLQ